MKVTKHTSPARYVSKIDHKRRANHNLDLYEYAMLEAMAEKFKEEVFDSKKDGLIIKRKLAFSGEEYKSTGVRLIKKGWLIRAVTGTTKIKINPKWFEFDKEALEDFQELWERLKKKGNKKNAKKMYLRCIKQGITHEYLMERTKKALIYKKKTGENMLHVSTFLNPENERFNDNFELEKIDKYGKDSNKLGRTNKGTTSWD